MKNDVIIRTSAGSWSALSVEARISVWFIDYVGLESQIGTDTPYQVLDQPLNWIACSVK